jgi:peptidoglycan/xylan/chitin deacetylase (PgdA/CDA1 family)/CelD/BcsL family acetyltransferase involved in cellulose biosynthesis
MTVREIRREDELQNLRPAWDALLLKSSSGGIFVTWEWVTAWWSKYGCPGELRIAAAFDRDGVLRGIAPMRSRELRRYGQTATTHSFIGDGSNDSDYLDFIIASGHEDEVMRAFEAYWVQELDRGVILVLNEMPESSPNLPFLRERNSISSNFLWAESDVDCASVALPGSWEEYLGILRPRFRSKIRSVLRNLESHPDVRFGFCDSREQVERLLPVLFDLHTRRWAKEGMPGVFGGENKRDFYGRLSCLLLERGWLRFSWLEWCGRVLACQYGFVYQGKYFQLQEGYEPASEHWNAGIGLRAWSIKELLSAGISEYDFLAGVGRHKTDWGAKVKRSKQITVARDSYRNRVFCHGPEWEARARELVKKALPAPIVSVRRAWIEKRTLAGYDYHRNLFAPLSQRRSGLRRIAAECYFHCGLPALVRRVRERYQFSISTGGQWPNISCSRRSQGSARILYYHRVNNDNDPFSPAISMELFEAEMRYIGRRYNVVSLPRLIQHLENRERENVVAITFDDGYEDNYRNAFPILQRYRLPATVFLTTGTIDSDEPLWFDKLARSLKTTERTCIDVEIDIPRRFWLRTEAERLEANAQIFGLLRLLDDARRTEQLGRILGYLAAKDGDRRGKMLSWDQVRAMHRQGIHFGGHTVTHPFLSKLPRDRAFWEVSECKRRIEEELQVDIDCFAYPNGREEDFSKWNAELLRSAGYRAAVTTMWGINWPTTDPMELRRGGPWEETAALFAYKLDWYQFTNG